MNSSAQGASVVPIGRERSAAEELLESDLDAFAALDSVDGVACSIALIAARSCSIPRTLDGRKPSRAVVFARAVRVLDTARALVLAMQRGASKRTK